MSAGSGTPGAVEADLSDRVLGTPPRPEPVRAGSCRPLGGWAGNLGRQGTGGDEASEVGSVVVNEAEQGRAAGVLPRQAQEVQACHLCGAAPMDYRAVADHAGNADPGV